MAKCWCEVNTKGGEENMARKLRHATYYFRSKERMDALWGIRHCAWGGSEMGKKRGEAKKLGRVNSESDKIEEHFEEVTKKRTTKPCAGAG